MSFMSKPFSLRMEEDTHELLSARASRTAVSASQLVNRYVKEGLRMDEHPAIGFVTAPSGERVAGLASRPRLKVIDIIGPWRGEGQDAQATAKYFDITEDDVQAVLRYYAAYTVELNAAVREHLAAQENIERVLQQRTAQVRRRVTRV